MDNTIDKVVQCQTNKYQELAYALHTQHLEARGEIENIIDKDDGVLVWFLQSFVSTQ